MSGKLPKFILKNCTLFLNKESKVGQTDEITLPTIELNTIEMRNGGMIKPREINMGFNTLESSFSLVGVDPALFRLFGIAPGVEFPMIAYGYMQDETGVSHSARAEMGCMIKKLDMGGWKPGEAAPVSNDCAVHNYRLFVDEQEVAAISDFEAVFDGVNAMPGMADALRIN